MMASSEQLADAITEIVARVGTPRPGSVRDLFDLPIYRSPRKSEEKSRGEAPGEAHRAVRRVRRVHEQRSHRGEAMITNRESGTRIDEIAPGIHRISTPVPPEAMPGGFTFNQFLIEDEQPLLYHTGPKKMFGLIREAIDRVLPAESLRWIGFSHYEADECGSLNEFLDLASDAEPLCSVTAKMVSVDDVASRPARAIGDGEVLSLGRHRVRWLDTPHFPHGWECGHLFEETTSTLFCGDLFTQAGHEHEALTKADILGPSEVMRASMDYYSATQHGVALADKLAATHPSILACMHGASWEGDGARLLRELGRTLGG
jgi:glyoxylase-like metal-dependent hydrolase (beta-lactamase superfamily II)